MALYYYLMAQLPTLVYEQKPPMSSEAFKELAGLLLTKTDAGLLKHLSLAIISPETSDTPAKKKKNTGCKFIDNWRDWECTLRLNLARHRSLKLYEKDTVEPPVNPADAFNTAAVVFTQDGSPLDGELMIDKARWSAIDSLASSNYFHRDNVFAYYLKLLILERHQLFNVENGFAEYKSLYSEIINSPHNQELNNPGEPK